MNHKTLEQMAQEAAVEQMVDLGLIMTFGQAMAVVSRFGYSNKCESFMDAIETMEMEYAELTSVQQDAFDTVMSEYEMMAEYNRV